MICVFGLLDLGFWHNISVYLVRSKLLYRACGEPGQRALRLHEPTPELNWCDTDESASHSACQMSPAGVKQPRWTFLTGWLIKLWTSRSDKTLVLQKGPGYAEWSGLSVFQEVLCCFRSGIFSKLQLLPYTPLQKYWNRKNRKQLQ